MNSNICDIEKQGEKQGLYKILVYGNFSLISTIYSPIIPHVGEHIVLYYIDAGERLFNVKDVIYNYKKDIYNKTHELDCISIGVTEERL